MSPRQRPMRATARTKLSAPMPGLARNADGDQIVFVHQGTGEFFCDYGHLTVRPGDYLVIPRGTMWRIEPSSPCAFLTIEARNAHFRLPDKGLLGRHAIFDPALLDTPAMDDTFRAQQKEDRPYTVEVKKRGEVSRVA